MASPTPLTAIAIRGDRIVYAGSDAGADPWVAVGTRVVDLRGRMVLPGFRDTHAHPATGGIEQAGCLLDDLETVSAVVEAIAGCVQRARPGSWIRGSGWALPLFPEANPHKDLLDAVAPDHPVILVAADGHSAWANSRALQAAGIDRSTPDPPNGRIMREAGSGEPSGTLRESAVRLITRQLPAYTQDEWKAGIQTALRMANRFGITTIHEAALLPETLAAYASLDAHDALTARVVAALFVDAGLGVAQVDSFISVREQYPATPFFRVNSAKIMADGVIESGTAALLAPYVGTSSLGTANFRPGQLDSLAAALDAASFRIHIHTIGDRAIRMSLDALAYARRQNGPSDARPILAHIQLFDPADIPRFAAEGIIGSFQSLWAYADTYVTDLTEPVLGPERSRWLYPIASLAATGATVVGGSDWNVSSMNPLDAIQVGMTRTALSDTTGPPWIPEERVDLTTLLRMYTINAAYAAGDEQENGTLEVGKLADIVVLERDLYQTPPAEIHTVPVALTIVGGKVVYEME
ncbi:MAG: amidohydrolase [Rhodothermales bacterium]